MTFEKVCTVVLFVTMEDSLESTGSSPPAQFIETDIKEMKRNLRGINKVIDRMDFEGACCFDNVYRDMGQVKKVYDHSISCIENMLIGMIANLETRFENMELKIAMLEATKHPGSSSHHSENFK